MLEIEIMARVCGVRCSSPRVPILNDIDEQNLDRFYFVCVCVLIKNSIKYFKVVFTLNGGWFACIFVLQWNEREKLDCDTFHLRSKLAPPSGINIIIILHNIPTCAQFGAPYVKLYTVLVFTRGQSSSKSKMLHVEEFLIKKGTLSKEMCEFVAYREANKCISAIIFYYGDFTIRIGWQCQFTRFMGFNLR